MTAFRSFLRRLISAFMPCQRLVEGDDVVDVLDTDGEADKLRLKSGVDLLLFGKLRMGRGGGMNHQRTRIADVGELRGGNGDCPLAVLERIAFLNATSVGSNTRPLFVLIPLR